MIKNIIFDYGGVIIKTKGDFDKIMAKKLNISVDDWFKLREPIHNQSIMGLISEDAALTKMAKNFNVEKRILKKLWSETLRETLEKDLYVILTEQVYTDKNGEIKPFTNRETEHIAKTIIKLEKIGIGKRKATIIKHRSQPEGKNALFKITNSGLE